MARKTKRRRHKKSGPGKKAVNHAFKVLRSACK